MSTATTLYVNPYTAGNPVYGDGFFGRDTILRQVARTLVTPGQNAVVLLGPRRVGKTSILLHLRHSLPPSRFTVVYQDLQDKARYPMGELLAGLADEIAGGTGLGEPNLSFDDQGQVFQHQFLPQTFDALPNKNQRLVLLLDEFDVLDAMQRRQLPGNAAANVLFSTLRRWMREEPRLVLVFALGRNLSDLDSDFLSTFKSGQTVRVSVLSKEDAVSLITAPNSLRYTDGAVKRIYSLTNGHPYFTQLFCSLCFDRAYDRLRAQGTQRPTITARDVRLLIPAVLDRGDNVFAWIWDGMPPAERIVASALAELLEDEKTVATDGEIEARIQAEGIRLITRDLEVSPRLLVEWQILHQVEGGYQFLVPIFHQWIRETKPVNVAREEIERLGSRSHHSISVIVEGDLPEMSQARQAAIVGALAKILEVQEKNVRVLAINSE